MVFSRDTRRSTPTSRRRREMTPGRRNALTVFAAVVSCVVFARGITGYDGGRTDDARAKWYRPRA